VEEARVRRAIVAAGARLGVRGLVSAAEGNLSIRLAADRLLVTPSGRRKDELEPDDLLVVPLDRPVDGDLPGPNGRRPRRISRSTARSIAAGGTLGPSSTPTCQRRWR